MRRTRLDSIWQSVNNANGAEVVEWIFWVGGLAIVTAILYASVSATLGTRASQFLN
jgi:hypothetical protein